MRMRTTKVIHTHEDLPEGAPLPNTMTLKCGTKAASALVDSENSRLIADHVVSIASFTARFVVKNQIECFRVGLILAMDGHAQEVGVIDTPEMVNAAISEFIAMMHKMVGDETMMQAVILRRQSAFDDMVQDAMDDIGEGYAQNN